jgi:hypothetical protein
MRRSTDSDTDHFHHRAWYDAEANTPKRPDPYSRRRIFEGRQAHSTVLPNAETIQKTDASADDIAEKRRRKRHTMLSICGQRPRNSPNN